MTVRTNTHPVKVNKEHECECCNDVIEKGEDAYYRNLFTGKRAYRHIVCPKDKERATFCWGSK